MATVTGDIGRAYGRSGIIALLSTVIAVPLMSCGMFATLTFLAATDYAPWAAIVIAVVWLGFMATAILAMWLSVRQRSKKLDGLFAPLGLAGSAYLTFFRQYHGTVYGRQIDAYVRRGPVLEIEVRTNLATRFGITQHQTDTEFFADLAGKRPLALPAPEHAGLAVYAIDERWTRSLLGDRTASDAIRRLVALGSSIFTRQQVLLAPGVLKAFFTGNTRMFGLDLHPQQVRVWVEDLVRVVQAAERIPAPTVTAETTSVEQFAAGLKRQNPYLALWIALGTVGFIIILGVVITVVILMVAR